MNAYKPMVVRARLHTKGRGGREGRLPESTYIKKANEQFDGLEVFLSLWDYDGKSAWHLWNWKKEDDEKIMMAIYEAEQEHPLQRYKGKFEKFKEDWKAGEYDPGCSFIFPLCTAEVLEVLQEEENNIDKEEVRKKEQQAKEEGFQRRRRQRVERKRRREKRRNYGKA